jgi:STE24 endopeptidase
MGFNLLVLLAYPTFIAPLFNKFSRLEDPALGGRIEQLLARCGFRSNGLYVMDGSRRSAHGNAYFTGLFDKKRVVLFDTLINMLNAEQTVAVLAHELGHFKLHHIRWEMIRSILFTGLLFLLLSYCLPQEIFYRAFHLQGFSSYGALVVFGLWFGPLSFVLKPFSSYLSRRNEFAADRFAILHMGNAQGLRTALLKLRQESRAMPLAHPWFSLFYYSHPPMLERLRAMN